MIRNNIRLAIRLLLRHKSITIINIIGLSFSMACVLFILLWVQQELSYDRFHPDYKQVCRVEENQFYSNPEPYHVTVTPHPSGPVWKAEIPEITSQCRITYANGLLLTHENRKFFENEVVATDSSFFNMFGFELLQGDPDAILNAPNTIVISEEIAKKYFGTTHALGKTLKVNNARIYTVTGVMKDPPKNTVLHAKILLPWFYQEQQPFYSDSWNNNSIYTYVKLVPGTAENTINSKITEVTNLHKEGNTTAFEVMPIHRIHLHAYFGYGKSPGAILYVYIFSAVALFVLIIACINFMNMSTARSSIRVKEIGLRKVNGASKIRLVRQHLCESFVQTVIAAFLALLIVVLFLHKFNDISGKELGLSTIFTLKYMIGFLTVILVTGILAGTYPAFHLSSLQPVRAIRQQSDTRTGSGLLRKILVIFQFSLSILLISGAIIVSRQLKYMQNADLGFDKHQLVSIPLRGGLQEHYETLKNELLRNPAVKNISASIHQPLRIGSNSSNIHWQGKDPDNEMLVSFTAVDYDFAKTMGIRILSGRGFSEKYPGDLYRDSLANFLINKTLADMISKEEVVGTELSFMGTDGQIVGVMDDFHFQPLSNGVEPLAAVLFPNSLLMNMFIRVQNDSPQTVLADMEQTWNKLAPGFPFEYSFVDEQIDNLYPSEQRMSKLISIFTVIAIIIACMGLLALASFNAERRTREIGIRKAFGATEVRIVKIMLVEITRLVFISLLIGMPAAWFLARRWLEDFFYRIDLSADIFIISSVLIILVSLITILYHAIKSARMNPVEAFRYE
ncbi:MAG: ABC transporter permease [Bacteroidales bacterium]|nr:ABC transporter permease [Bacteroidales bacterium]